MIRADYVTDQLKKDLGDIPVAKACLDVVKYIVSTSGDIKLSLTYAHLADIMSVPRDSGMISVVANLLSAHQFNVLSPELFYLSNSGPVPLDDEALEYLRTTGQLADPDTGELVEDPQSHLVPLFRADPAWLKAEASE